MPIETTERRRQPRTNLSEVLFIRASDSRLAPDSCTSLNVSKDGLYLATLAGNYAPGLKVCVTSEFHVGTQLNFISEAIVVRVEKLEDGRWGVAIQICAPSSSTSD
jgi:hypothetical protein